MNRFMTRRDKTGTHRYGRSKSSEPGIKSRPVSSGIFSIFKPQESKKQEKSDVKKLQVLRQRLRDTNVTSLDDSQVEYVLQSKYADGDESKAFELLLIVKDSMDGIVRPYDPNVHMLGAENRGNVTCWLDSLLFAMFARLGSFEPILYTKFDDEPRRQLATLIRLWVNMLRTGKLIQTDLTEHLQEALKDCGWEEAALVCQNDASEAFSFITETLQLPLLTMEMDIFHEGGGDKDDHKFINERLLEVAIPAPVEGRAVRLEDCLEEHFNARVEVVRRLERRDTLNSLSSGLPPLDETKDDEKRDAAESPEAIEIEYSTISTPAPRSPTTTRPSLSRQRAPSIIRRIIVPENEGESSVATPVSDSPQPESIRKGAVRKEVLMPAWQFFRIIPWYTANVPTNDAQVAAHFSSARPVLGICLKRYAMSTSGRAIRQNTAVDIPLQIALPHFIQDDKATEDGPLFGNFKLVLQSMVCHRGNSVHAGHYISIIRGLPKTTTQSDTSHRSYESPNGGPPEYFEDKWIKLDDLASERVTYVDIEQALLKEMPYLLFYQVQPLFDEEPQPSGMPPPYEDQKVAVAIQAASPTGYFPELSEAGTYFNSSNPSEEWTRSRISFSDDLDRPRRSLNLSDSERRGSVANTDRSAWSTPVTPGEEAEAPAPQGRLSRAASRFSRSGRGSKSRPTSHVDESRLSSTFSRLNLIRSKETLAKPADAPNTEASKSTSVTDFAIANSSASELLQSGPKANETTQPLEKENSSHSKKSKDVEKGKEAYGNHHHHHHHVHHGGKGENNFVGEKANTPDRECILM